MLKRILIIGAGVAGLQAIATAKRLGGIVFATDVRMASKEQVESSGLEKSKRGQYEADIASKLDISPSEIYVDIPPFSVVAGLKAKILKNDGNIDFARNLSRLVLSLYEAQFDHWRCRVYSPPNIRKEVASASQSVLGI